MTVDPSASAVPSTSHSASEKDHVYIPDSAPASVLESTHSELTKTVEGATLAAQGYEKAQEPEVQEMKTAGETAGVITRTETTDSTIEYLTGSKLAFVVFALCLVGG